MLIAVVPVLAVLVGLLLWTYSEQPIAKESGRILFAAGILVLLLHMSTAAVKLF
jgi:hypothetical protein